VWEREEKLLFFLPTRSTKGLQRMIYGALFDGGRDFFFSTTTCSDSPEVRHACPASIGRKMGFSEAGGAWTIGVCAVKFLGGRERLYS
jgi:hypothetical protein